MQQESGVAKVKDKLKKIDSPVYNYFSALFYSFYSKFLYLDVAKRWRGFGLIYLLLVTAIASIPYSLKVAYTFNELFNTQIIGTLLQLPTILVQSGKVKFDKPMPYLIRNKDGEVVIIIDTKNSITEFTTDYPKLSIIVNEKKMSYKVPTPDLVGLTMSEGQKNFPLVQEFSDQYNMMFDGKSIVNESSVYSLKYAAQLMIYPLIVSLIYSIFLIVFLVLAFLGQLFTRIFFSYVLPFKQSCRIFMVASTPTVFLLALCIVLGLNFGGMGYFLMTILFAYYCFAVFHLKADSRKMVKK
jgi:hypothetical protein